MRISFSLLFLFAAYTLLGQSAHRYCSKYKGSTEGKRLVIDDRRSDSVDIVHTHLVLDFTDMSSEQMSGSAVLTIRAKRNDVQRVRFDLEGLQVDDVQANGLAGYDAGANGVVLEFSSALPTQQDVEVEISYSGSPLKDASGWGGFYFTGNFAWNLGVGFAADPHSYGRIWFPCFDNFIERSTFSFVVTTPGDKLAACNGLLQDSTTNQDGTKTYTWQLDQPIPSYLACVAIGEYVSVESTYTGIEANVPVQLFARAGDTANLIQSFVHLHDALAAFEAAYGDYKFEKAGYSLVPFNGGAMEHATNIAYPISAANGSLNSESLMTHELAHMWWGDNVTCETDGDMWINEGWASFSEFVFEEAVYGRPAYEKSMLADLRYMLQFGHHFEDGYRPVSGQPHEYVYGDHVYKKGALVAHNLRGYLGDSLFFPATQAFMDEFEFQPVSSDSLERFMSAYSGKDLNYFFRDWVFQPGWNTVVLDSFHAEAENGTYQVSLFLQQKLKGTAQFHDEVPVYVSCYDAQWNKVERVVQASGKYTHAEIAVPFEPVWVVLNERNQLAQALTADQVVVSQTGSMDLDNMYWDVVIDEVSDSALIRFEQVWSYPDPVKDWSNKPYKLNDNRYWRVSGLGLENVELSGQFFYDGRSSGANGYLDINLLTETEDSLVLLYRPDAAFDWEEYAHYTKNVLGLSTNGVGLIELDRILPGEYTLANVDHDVLDVQSTSINGINLFPNPTTGEVFVDNAAGKGRELKMYSLEGRLLHTWKLEGESDTINVSVLPPGVVIYEVRGAHSEVVSSGKLVIQSRP